MPIRMSASVRPDRPGTSRPKAAPAARPGTNRRHIPSCEVSGSFTAHDRRIAVPVNLTILATCVFVAVARL